MPIIINKIQRIVIPLVTRLGYDVKSIIIIGGTKKKKIFDTLKIKYFYINNSPPSNDKHIENLIDFFSKGKNRTR
jgi:hypothetical protein